MKTNLLTLAALIMLPFAITAQRIIPYSVTPIRGASDGLTALFDNNTQTGWFGGWNAGDYPTIAKVKFEDTVTINKVRVFDWTGSPTLILYQGSDTIKIKLNKWNEYQSKTFRPIKLKEINISISDIQGDIPVTEIEFYNDSTAYVPVRKTYQGSALTIGTNGFHWDNTDVLTMPNIRLFQMLQWTWTKEGLAVNPTRQADGNYDDYYRELKQKGITAIPCINKAPEWSHYDPNDQQWADRTMNDPNTDPNKPESYRSIAEYAFQLSARYGRVKHPSTSLKVNQLPRWNGDPINIPLSGLDLLNYIELENEPDRPWNQPKHKYTPEQFAAFLSAVYDGHEGTMGANFGIKQADPTMMLVMGGLSSFNLTYVGRMDKWFKANRKDKRFACDLLNFHHYCNVKNPQLEPDINLWEGYGVSPKQDNLYYRLKDLILFVDNNINKDIKVWYSEFGYDTYPCSTKLCQYSTEQDQAKWIVQTYLMAIAAKVDKSFVYLLSDLPNYQTGYIFHSSGLLKTENRPKESYKAVNKLMDELNGFTLKEEKGDWLIFTSNKQIKEINMETLEIKTRQKGWIINRERRSNLIFPTK